MVYSASQRNEKFGNSKNGKQMRSITRVVKILEKFVDNYEKRLNFTKLSHLLHLTPTEVDEIITLIMSFQELFSTTFNKYSIKKGIDVHSLAQSTFTPDRYRFPYRTAGSSPRADPGRRRR